MRNLFVLGLAAVSAFAGAQSFYDSFESADYTGMTPSGGTVASVINWTGVNASTPVGTTSWFDGNALVFPANSGVKYLGANYNNTGSSGSSNLIDNYLMSEVRIFNNGDNISFFTRTVDNPFFPDRLYLKLSQNGASTSVGDFSTTLATVNGGLTAAGYPNTWTLVSATITGLSGPTAGRFAFNYNVPSGGLSGNNSDYIGIDDVRYSAVPEPATIAALGLGAVAMIRRRRSK